MRLSDREKILGLIVIMLVGFYFYDRLILEPVLAEVKQLDAETNQLCLQKEANQELIILNQKVQQEVGSLDYSDDMETLLPVLPHTAEVISYLSECARNQSLVLCFIHFKLVDSERTSAEQGITAETTPKAINLQLGVQGDYDKLISFLVSIENAPRIYKINHSNLKVVDPAGIISDNQESGVLTKDPTTSDYDRNQATLTLDLSVFYD
jgi:Tfp pilus assembly protein PilO